MRRSANNFAGSTSVAAVEATARARDAQSLPRDLDLTLVSRRPPRLTAATLRAADELAVPVAPRGGAASPPRASVVVVTFNNLPFTKLCIASLLRNTEPPDYELVAVDNASTDGTVEYLSAVARANRHVRVVLNGENRGFAPANNQGLAIAKGHTLVLVNNDTVLPPGWLGRLEAHLRRPDVGAVGAVTNRIGNEAEVEADYRTYGQMVEFAERRARRHKAQSFEIPMPAMFCLAMRREVYERVGPLDERFAVGMLEDDDYARRVRDAGYRLACAEDAFVHHFGQASFGKLVPSGEYMRLLEANQRRYQEKWGEPWRQYGRRASPRYERLVPAVRRAVARFLPEGATVLVVSRGDDELVRLEGRRGWHFPRGEGGGYAGCYPGDGAAAVAHLEALRGQGAQFLVVPATSLWWLDHYAEFARHLSDGFETVARDDDVLIVDLRRRVECRG